MKPDFTTRLPREIIIDILSGLPIRSIVSCKCVCKSLLSLVESPEFAESHLSKSVQGLAVLEENASSNLYKCLEFVAELNGERSVHCNEVLNFSFPHHHVIRCSVNGLLFWCDEDVRPNNLFIGNPITHEFIKLPAHNADQYNTFGFGVSKIAGQYKLVRIFKTSSTTFPPWNSEVYVYTVGTGSWRRIAGGSSLDYDWDNVGVFVNGNLHWLALDSDYYEHLSCFDLETERFSSFSFPPEDSDYPSPWSLSTLDNCLCLCNKKFDQSAHGYKIDVWLMKEYGDGKSWTKRFTISIPIFNMPYHGEYFAYFRDTVKVFQFGCIFITRKGEGGSSLWCYSSKTKTIEELPSENPSRAVTYTPSFLRLKMFRNEKGDKWSETDEYDIEED